MARRNNFICYALVTASLMLLPGQAASQAGKSCLESMKERASQNVQPQITITPDGEIKIPPLEIMTALCNDALSECTFSTMGEAAKTPPVLATIHTALRSCLVSAYRYNVQVPSTKVHVFTNATREPSDLCRLTAIREEEEELAGVKGFWEFKAACSSR